MIYTYTPLTGKIALRWWFFILSLNTFFAVYFWSLIKVNTLYYHFVFSQLNGLTILHFAALANVLLKNVQPHTRFVVIFIFCNIGSLVGKYIATKVLGVSPLPYDELMLVLILNFLIISIIMGFLYYWERIAATKARLQEEQIKRLDIEKQVVQSRFKLIQTQIEPHFLFSILTHIVELLQIDLKRAKSLQLLLIRYLRLAHARYRSESNFLGQEMEMVQTYLDIIGSYMGDRLTCEIDIADHLNKIVVPSMLIPSLVEKLADHQFIHDHVPARIAISGKQKKNDLRLEITGSGFPASFKEDLESRMENIKNRLTRTFGHGGKLFLENISSGQLHAVMEFPLTYHPTGLELQKNRGQERP